MLFRSGDDIAAELSDTWAWLADQQQKGVHAFTSSPAGGWGWTHLAGGVPDADDTSAALLALRGAMSAGEGDRERWIAAGASGVQWLLGLQNKDGGWPTFCRGWGKLPFDRSGCDLTAHAVRAISSWRVDLPELEREIGRAVVGGLNYLAGHQRADGSWLPLWFGSQGAADGLNPTVGTSRVLAVYRDLDLRQDRSAQRGVAWLLGAQGDDGSWGGAAGLAPTVEETSLAVEGLCGFAGEEVSASCDRAAAWLCENVKSTQIDNPAPIGLYFTSLWYWERLYPSIWSASAFGRYLGLRGGFKG